MSRKMRVFTGSTTALIMLALMSVHLQAAQVQLTWTAPTTNDNPEHSPLTDLAGYRVYYGQTSGNLTQNVDVGNQTMYLLSGLAGGQILKCFPKISTDL